MPLRWKINFCEDKVNLKLGRIEIGGWIREKKERGKIYGTFTLKSI